MTLKAINSEGGVPIFHNSELNSLMHRFEKSGKVRFTLLDRFNKDCQSLTKLFKKFAVPDLDWVSLELPLEEYSGYRLGYHNQTIVCSQVDQLVRIDQAIPIYEATAEARIWIAENNLLPLLMQDACCTLEDFIAKAPW